MNELFSSRVSYYDIFAILSPGLIISYLLVPSYFDSTGEDGKVFAILTIGFMSYFIGLLWNKVSEIAFFWFRNNESHIREVQVNGQNVQYYDAYYCLQLNGMLGNVPLLEGQVAFLRNHIGLVPILVSLFIHKVVDLGNVYYPDWTLCLFLLVLVLLCRVLVHLIIIITCSCVLENNFDMCGSKSDLTGSTIDDTNKKISCYDILYACVFYLILVVCSILFATKMKYEFSWSYFFLSLLVGGVVCLLGYYVMYCVQRKIYSLVFEGYFYLLNAKKCKPQKGLEEP